MTPEEAKSWKEETAKSKDHWRVDRIHSDQNRDLLLYIGGEKGHYAHVYLANGKAALQVGQYEDAIPHIGDATFKIQGTKKFDTMDDAFVFLIERGGVKFLQDILSMPRRTARSF